MFSMFRIRIKIYLAMPVKSYLGNGEELPIPTTPHLDFWKGDRAKFFEKYLKKGVFWEI